MILIGTIAEVLLLALKRKSGNTVAHMFHILKVKILFVPHPVRDLSYSM